MSAMGKLLNSNPIFRGDEVIASRENLKPLSRKERWQAITSYSALALTTVALIAAVALVLFATIVVVPALVATFTAVTCAAFTLVSMVALTAYIILGNTSTTSSSASKPSEHKRIQELERDLRQKNEALQSERAAKEDLQQKLDAVEAAFRPKKAPVATEKEEEKQAPQKKSELRTEYEAPRRTAIAKPLPSPPVKEGEDQKMVQLTKEFIDGLKTKFVTLREEFDQSHKNLKSREVLQKIQEVPEDKRKNLKSQLDAKIWRAWDITLRQKLVDVIESGALEYDRNGCDNEWVGRLDKLKYYTDRNKFLDENLSYILEVLLG